MTEKSKQTWRWIAWGVEIFIALALLAVLAELAMIYYNPPEEMINVRFAQRNRSPGEEAPPVPPARNPDHISGGIASKQPAAPRAIRRNPDEMVSPQQLLSFENLRRQAQNVFGGDPRPPASTGPNGSPVDYQPSITVNSMSFGGGGSDTNRGSAGAPPSTNDTNNAAAEPMPRNSGDELSEARRRAGHDSFRLAIP